ncbi:unnamed protein product, partial [Amoebophrya sp. A120]
ESAHLESHRSASPARPQTTYDNDCDVRGTSTGPHLAGSESASGEHQARSALDVDHGSSTTRRSRRRQRNRKQNAPKNGTEAALEMNKRDEELAQLHAQVRQALSRAAKKSMLFKDEEYHRQFRGCTNESVKNVSRLWQEFTKLINDLRVQSGKNWIGVDPQTERPAESGSEDRSTVLQPYYEGLLNGEMKEQTTLLDQIKTEFTDASYATFVDELLHGTEKDLEYFYHGREQSSSFYSKNSALSARVVENEDLQHERARRSSSDLSHDGDESSCRGAAIKMIPPTAASSSTSTAALVGRRTIPTASG